MGFHESARKALGREPTREDIERITHLAVQNSMPADRETTLDDVITSLEQVHPVRAGDVNDAVREYASEQEALAIKARARRNRFKVARGAAVALLIGGLGIGAIVNKHNQSQQARYELLVSDQTHSTHDQTLQQSIAGGILEEPLGYAQEHLYDAEVDGIRLTVSQHQHEFMKGFSRHVTLEKRTSEGDLIEVRRYRGLRFIESWQSSDPDRSIFFDAERVIVIDHQERTKTIYENGRPQGTLPAGDDEYQKALDVFTAFKEIYQDSS